ncbi:putative disease resistance protein At3g14460 [Olea europaea var. sylvestris]|uniref:putative disease resistance protein At3g14460 n=1 Tax=Olea europaea var. sylvestris TaxID=158386 RepID=UPI000C1CFD6B|nr:putative disease resistance protein At3g14460 [Olea europaea var. sylvestris]XP_022872726.1 putative disease resistance protein At3g14460 [Olea europaea var. sylvestris]XP_022872727.1 putative disease resistance protein At3g14460 [Olea europaea var. sylvestris]XP_022872728.1 putative disease resistance protein At3g14460 [Olea europaea var. sylvestris]
MAIVEVSLDPILSALLEKLASGELLKFLRRIGIDAQMKGWRRTLLMIQAVLTDAENRQITSQPVKEWLNNLEDLAYDLEDFVDELNTEALQRKLRKNKGSSNMAKWLIPNNLSYIDFMFNRRIASKLKEISFLLEDISKNIEVLSLGENVWVRPFERLRTYARVPTTSFIAESEVYGRAKDREQILKILVGVESNDSQITVVPIIGMGGVGKTTLVQLVYNDERLKDKFDLKAWVCVSVEFDAVRVTKCVLELVSGERCDYEDFPTLQSKLKDILSNKKFLVVLDDVWNEYYDDWDILRRPFLAGKPGSTIIITTRQERVAKIMSGIPAYLLNQLSEGDALSLLARHAFGAKTFDRHPDLIEIGKSMVRRCKMLPLAVKALGRVLCNTAGREEWEEVLKSEIWMDEEKSEIPPALKLSYHYLRPELKRCFAYCALFPKDYMFEKLHLVHFWMAEGLVQEFVKDRLIEDVGSQYFDELLDRSFFQQSSTNSSCFVMHDLFNDLAKLVAGDRCLRMDDALKENLPSKISQKVHHLSFKRTGYDTYPRFSFLNKVKKLRTLLSLPVDAYSNYISQRILLHLLPNLYCLRVLSLNGYSIYELPDSIGDLRHLRYLGLAQTLLKWLPESVSTLINLQVLIIRGCWNLTKLPTSMENLINLRHLDIAATPKLHEMPHGIAQLTSLRTLTKMTASESKGMGLKDLGNLSFLQGEISIEELQNVVNVQEAMDARLMDKPGLNKIRLQWNEVFDDSRNKFFELDVLNALKPHENLSTLEIKYFGGMNFSNWIGDSAFLKLAKVSFEFCENCVTLPPLGQLPLLRDLSIRGIRQVKLIGAEFYGNRGHGELPFPSLISLTFEDMCNWEEWLGIEGVIELSQLRKLKISCCSKLVRLPNLLLPSLCELEATECNEVVLNHMQNLESLTQIRLTRIFGLTSVINAFLQFPFKLESFEVIGCDDLETLFPSDSTARNLVNLRKVVVESCPSLLSLQEIDVLPDLRTLTVEQCRALEWLPTKISCLEEVFIRECPSLKTMMNLQDCSTSLSSLFVKHWVNLNLTNLLGSGHNYGSLTELYIWSCDGLEYFPHGGLPTPNLKILNLRGCQHLKSLPDRMELLWSLLYLEVNYCSSLMEIFSQENSPPNLSHLDIKDCGRKLKPLGEWNLHKLTSLKNFCFGGCPKLVSFTNNADKEQCVLPPSLIQLELVDLPNLTTLSKDFQNLTSLQQLRIYRCPKLVALPLEDQLQKLSSLWIRDCPLIKKRCLRNKGKYWPIIADIPDVEIDFYSIYDSFP